MGNNFKLSTEWLKQAEYDMDTAKSMLKTGKFIYAVFMCHLATEKVIKGIYSKVIKKDPPKTHDLVYLSELTSLDLPEDLAKFLDSLNDLSIPTRYPDELEKIICQYNRERTKEIIKKTEKLLQCLKEKMK